MKLASLNTLCFVVAVASILAGGILSLVMVWNPAGSETLWRRVATVGIVFLSSLAMLSVSRTYGEPRHSGWPPTVDGRDADQRHEP
jgi:predicted membrane channel-forming protein YqfA (hemolysin III family)